MSTSRTVLETRGPGDGVLQPDDVPRLVMSAYAIALETLHARWLAADRASKYGTPRPRGCGVYGSLSHVEVLWETRRGTTTANAVYAALFDARLEAARALNMPIRATVRPDAKKLFVRHRFAVVRELTNYTVYELAPAKKRAS